MGSRFKLKKTILLVSQPRTIYAEADDRDITHHCYGNSKLKLCQRTFATTSRPQTGCLSSLFTGMERHVLEQCEQKVETLPLQPRTASLGLSTFRWKLPKCLHLDQYQQSKWSSYHHSRLYKLCHQAPLFGPFEASQRHSTGHQWRRL